MWHVGCSDAGQPRQRVLSVDAGERGAIDVNVATAIPTARFNALILSESHNTFVEGDKTLTLEEKIREEGCSVHRATTRSSALETLVGTDLVIIATSPAITHEDVLDVVGKASDASVLVITTDQDLALRVAKLGASVVAGSELAALQVKQLLEMIDLKRKIARQSMAPSDNGSISPTSGVVQRRSAPLPKEATPEALDALVAAAEGLVPMHKFQRVYVDYALRRFGGNKVHTAAALGIDRRTIQRWARARSEQRPQVTTTTTQSS